MEEAAIVKGFNEWLRQYTADPQKFQDMQELRRQKAAGIAQDYGQECLHTLQEMAQ